MKSRPEINIVDSPTVSICIPVYNGEKYLHECIQSAISQSYKNIEILCVDDGSKDQSVDIIKQYQQHDKRIRLIESETNKGLVGNWNKCIQEANGNWIKFLFQDDTLVSECVEKMMLVCERDNTQVGICNRRFVIDKDADRAAVHYFTNKVLLLHQVIKNKRLIHPIELAEAAKKNLLNNFLGEPITLLFHKDVCKQYGLYNEDLVQLVDYEFALRIGLHNNISFIDEPLASFRVHASSASGHQIINEEKKLKSRFIEPLLLYYQYLYNPYFKNLLAVYGKRKLLRKTVAFFETYKPDYLHADEALKQLSSKYNKIHIFYFYGFFYRMAKGLHRLLHKQNRKQNASPVNL